MKESVKTVIGGRQITFFRNENDNPGNHYKDAAYRLAKGITWILK